MRKTKENAGITLIALIITIIVLLILAGISIITLTGQNGILTQANKAKQESELAEEKEKAGLVSQELKIEKAQGKDVDKTGFQKMVDSQFGSSKATGDVEDSTYVIVVAKTGNIYLINEDGTIDEAGNKNDMKKDENPGVLEDLGNNTYAVNSIEDLVALSYTVNSGADTYEDKTVILGRSLYFNGMFDSYANPDSKYEMKSNDENSKKLGYIPNESATTTIKELVTTGSGFIPIGLDTEGKRYKGNFDGKNNYLEELYINKDDYGVGLFGSTDGIVNISNLGIKSGTIEGNGYTGAIVGFNFGELNINNCYNKANVHGGQFGAGILGMSMYTQYSVVIKDCYNTGKAEGNMAGGIVGMVNAKEGSQIYNCYNTGDVSGTGYIAGIEGMGNLLIEKCYNIGKISGQADNNVETRVAGIAAGATGNVNECYNKGKISKGMCLAGVVNRLGNCAITNCFNTGIIEPSEKRTGQVAGIVTANSGSRRCKKLL